jgi:DNA modification methylase
MWLNIGDGHWGGKGQNGQENRASLERRSAAGKSMNKPHQNINVTTRPQDKKHITYKAKDLIGMPWRIALAMQGFATVPGKILLQWVDKMARASHDQDWNAIATLEQEMRRTFLMQCFVQNGWILRQDIIWFKRNVNPESTTDRCTTAHEYLFLLSKKKKYKYNAEAIKEIASEGTKPRISRATEAALKRGDHAGHPIRSKKTEDYKPGVRNKNNDQCETAKGSGVVEYRNKRSVWDIPTEGAFGEHTATFPQSFAAPCILAGSDKGDLVFDPFVGEGTTLIVAEKLERNYLGIDVHPKNQQTYYEYRAAEFGMFA